MNIDDFKLFSRCTKCRENNFALILVYRENSKT